MIDTKDILIYMLFQIVEKNTQECFDTPLLGNIIYD